ncbi:receptor-type tyrosine-protein phosphatase zeta [Colias croceus]|uniref:receptor-type tyrosine-protein phosphatase zeta n=1 Tax=Colias crocea TaxID=72248 RepID=UPI001E28101D|nr:receptor-type tyrosine-protein phosphatase zeta [Colias croceus]XP_045501461.1 receptor-type tyrosine-protein phosphatase zeta [Colias croceus]XP_045501462.1 receptor-type tyrosine-protein phosphatase zeta [Colias croceus]XP_045501463.1 receptor-type tyrosine-protein phosphatase zeta [Colias croceus]
MESPVRICLGAVLVVNLLLLSSTQISGHTLPQETTPTLTEERSSRRANSTWISRNKPKLPDVALNELHHKDTSSEENTEKNAKYKDRGRVRFNVHKSTTESSLRRVRSSTEASNVIIVTPTPEVKKPLEIIDSMRNYKKTKVSSTTEAMKTKAESQEELEEDDEDTGSYEKYTSSKFSDNSFFTSSFNDDEFSDKNKDGKDKNRDFSKSPFDFSNFFSKQSYTSNDESYKSDSFFDFDSELTTPKNDFFDKKYQEISSSILKNLDTIKAKQPPANGTNMQKIVKENIGFEKLSNATPHNTSTVIIKNTKEIRLMDNDKAGTDNSALSDVHGTSIYYEMSVLSTETYNITHTNDDDCDEDESSVPETTKSTPVKDELASITPSQKPMVEIPTDISKPVYDNEIGSTISSYFFPVSVAPTISSANPISSSYQNTVFSSERPIVVSTTSNPPRNRNYSKRLNLTGTKELGNNAASQSDQVSPNLVNRPNTRRFFHTTPKSRPVWMAPGRNVTRTSPTRVPSTIYSEHFDIKNRYSTQDPGPSRILTTLPSDIDPLLQSDIGGSKRVVHSHSFVDNKIPSLWKRGSTKFFPSSSSSTTTTTTTTTTTSAPHTTLMSEEQATTEARRDVNDFEILPTLAAWALAGLRSPPTRPAINVTGSTKNIDENELQKVGDIIEKRETTTSSTSTTPSSVLNRDIVLKNITEIDQNRLPWKPVFSSSFGSEGEIKDKTTESISERVPAESNISLQNSEEPATTETIISNEETTARAEIAESQSSWVASTVNLEQSSSDESEVTSQDTIPPVDPTKATGFESITKLPSDITTPSDDIIDSSDEKNEIVKATTKMPITDYEITTIRFSYVPTEPTIEVTETEAPTTDWHYAGPMRTRPTTTIQDAPITTYRPKYYTTTNAIEESTTIEDTTPQNEVSSQIMEKTTNKEPTTTESVTTDIMTETPTAETQSIETTTEPATTETEKTTTPETTTEMETTTIVVTVATEINTEIATVMTEAPSTVTQTETVPITSSEENIDFNEVVTQEAKPATTEATTITTTTEKELEKETTLFTTTETVTQQNGHFVHTDTTEDEESVETTTEAVTKDEDDESTTYAGEITTEASSRVLDDAVTGSGAGIAIAVSTIGVIALILLIGLLLVVRRRGRRGVYAQRCTPVSLDAYSLDSVSVGHRKGNQRLRASKRSYGNPAYDDEVTSHPMNYAALANFALDIDSITAEFTEIPTVTVRPEEVPPGCEDKNRYSNVLPLPETRVPLKRIGGDPTTEYINANYVTGPGNIRNYYIACQAPLSNTVVDFWRMMWEQNSRLIVMLTEYLENGVEKCYEYLPPSEISDNRRTFGEFQIILKKREQRDRYAISSVQLINLSTRTWREITHLWYFWPAKGVPEDYESVIDFLSEMRSYMKISQTAKEYDEEGLEVIYEDQNRSSYNNLSKLRSDDASGNGVNVYSPAKAEELLRRGYSTNGTLGKMKVASEVEGVRPCVVVCASGAGRSAALIAADICSRALAAGAADLPRTVRALRTQRPHSISNRHHYIFLYRLLSEYGNRLMGGGVDTI